MTHRVMRIDDEENGGEEEDEHIGLSIAIVIALGTITSTPLFKIKLKNYLIKNKNITNYF